MTTHFQGEWQVYTPDRHFARQGAPRSCFKVREFNGFTLVVDLDREATMSVTNDAERVVEYCLRHFGNQRILYRDSMEQWDELGHDGFQFTTFKPMLRCFKIDREAGV